MSMLLDRPLRRQKKEAVQAPLPPILPPEPEPVIPTFEGTLADRMRLKAYDGIMMVVGSMNHPVVMWYRDNPTEVAEAREVFNTTKATGALLYRTEAGDGPNAEREQIRDFDETAPQIVTVPRFVGG